MITIQKSIIANWMIEKKAGMEIASMTSAIFVTQETWDALQSRTIDVIFLR